MQKALLKEKLQNQRRGFQMLDEMRIAELRAKSSAEKFDDLMVLMDFALRNPVPLVQLELARRADTDSSERWNKLWRTYRGRRASAGLSRKGSRRVG